jgi:hypothetical protein
MERSRGAIRGTSGKKMDGQKNYGVRFMVFIFLPLHIFAHLSSVLLYWRPNLRFGPWLRANCSVAKVNWAKRWMGKKKYGNPFAMPHLFALTFFCPAHSNFLRLELERHGESFT